MSGRCLHLTTPTAPTLHHTHVLQQHATGRKLSPQNDSRRFSEWRKLFEFLVSKAPDAQRAVLEGPSAPTVDQVRDAWAAVSPVLRDNVKFAEATQASTNGTATKEQDKYLKQVGSQGVYTAYGYAFRKRQHGGGDAPAEGFVYRRIRAKKNKTTVPADDAAAAMAE